MFSYLKPLQNIVPYSLLRTSKFMNSGLCFRLREFGSLVRALWPRAPGCAAGAAAEMALSGLRL